MERHFHEELKDLKQELFQMGLFVKAAIEKSVQALLEHKDELARQVLEDEKMINRLEIEIDDKGHSLSALGQPMAVDLRMLTAILKMNTDLERMGDHAVNIAERALILIEAPAIEADFHLPQMARSAMRMLEDALNAFAGESAELARSVLVRDDEVDAYNDELYIQLAAFMEQNPASIRAGMNLVLVGHNLERIADLANNIAEGVVYMKQGKDIRHRIDTTHPL
jgi:phosphate transport system protein